jgi:transcriptional regulator of acetoin/glycerol metabolism
MHAGRMLEARDLDPKFTAPAAVTTTFNLPAIMSIPENEQQQLTEALAKTHGNRSEAARLLNMPRRTFYRKLEKWGLL